MKWSDFVKETGWPQDHMQEAGDLKWSAKAADGMSKLEAGVVRDGLGLRAWVRTVGLEGIEPMLTLEASEANEGEVRVKVASIGNPPDSVEPEEALGLFKHMSSGMGYPVFRSAGPLKMEKKSGTDLGR